MCSASASFPLVVKRTSLDPCSMKDLGLGIFSSSSSHSPLLFFKNKQVVRDDGCSLSPPQSTKPKRNRTCLPALFPKITTPSFDVRCGSVHHNTPSPTACPSLASAGLSQNTKKAFYDRDFGRQSLFRKDLEYNPWAWEAVRSTKTTVLYPMRTSETVFRTKSMRNVSALLSFSSLALPDCGV
jgi:hypothetical protein